MTKSRKGAQKPTERSSPLREEIYFKSRKGNKMQFLSNFWPHTIKPDICDPALVQEELRVEMKVLCERKVQWLQEFQFQSEGVDFPRKRSEGWTDLVVVPTSEHYYQYHLFCWLALVKGAQPGLESWAYQLYGVYATKVLLRQETALEVKKASGKGAFVQWAYEMRGKKRGEKKRIAEDYDRRMEIARSTNVFETVMKEALNQKFSPLNPEHRRALLETGDAVLKEQRGRTVSEWDCSSEDGVGILGNLLMEVRSDIRDGSYPRKPLCTQN